MTPICGRYTTTKLSTADQNQNIPPKQQLSVVVCSSTEWFGYRNQKVAAIVQVTQETDTTSALLRSNGR